MCTASWILEDEGLELYFNRDESPTRLPARPPELHHERGMRFLAPVDGEAGGTWIGVNERGLALALLNANDVRGELGPGPAERSRGLLLRELLVLEDGTEVRAELAARPPRIHRAFELLVFEADDEPFSVAWDGQVLDEGPVRLPTTSSSFDPAGVQAARSELFARVCAEGALTLEGLEAFQRSHWPEKGTLSPCMHRAEAGTVSCTHLSVRPDRVSLRYAGGPPCRTPFGEPVSLARTLR